MTSFQRNNIIYIPFVGEQYTEENIHNVFSNFQIGTIRTVRFVENNYMIGTLELGSVEEVWGRPAIIEMENWEENEFTRSINFSINMGMMHSSVEFDGPDGDYWLIQSYNNREEHLPSFFQENHDNENDNQENDNQENENNNEIENNASEH
jgi:hypothetical protein